MKKYRFLIFLLLLVNMACNPMEDINNELESDYTGPVRDNLKDTLTYADYKTISELVMKDATTPDEYNKAEKIAEDTVLYSGLSATYIPYILNSKSALLGYGKGSVVTVTYYSAEAIDSSKNTVDETFVVAENLEWKAPSVIKYQFTQTDYQALTTYVKNSSELSKYWENYRNGREIYYGSSPNYSNFDMRYATRAIEDSEREAAFDPILVDLYKAGLATGDYTDLNKKLEERALEGMMLMLQMKYADGGAVIESNGSTITYEIRALWFMEGYVNQNVTCKYECTKASPNAEFKLVEGPIYE
ncbi:MAG: hypothetical protein ACK5MG_07590 [Bacteroidales bacterium]